MPPGMVVATWAGCLLSLSHLRYKAFEGVLQRISG